MTNNKLIVAIPGHTFSERFLNSWTHFLKQAIDAGWGVELNCSYNSLTHRSRSLVMGYGPSMQFNNHGKVPYDGLKEYDYMLLVDSDILFNFEDFTQLVSRDKDVISGMYKMRHPYGYSAHKNGDWINKEYIDSISENPVIEADYGGLGFTLVKRNVLENTTGPMFFADTLEDNIGEDVTFFRRIQAAGFQTYWDTSILVGHESSYVMHHNWTHVS